MLTIKQFLIVCPLVFVAGFVDAIGGGGGLISLPAYLIAGLPTHMASATNKLSATVGTVASTFRYIKNKCCDLKLALPGIVTAVIGANLGAKVALMVSNEVFKIVLLVLLPVIALYMVFKKDLEPREVHLTVRKQALVVAALSLLLGFYDGFYGPGVGTFLIIAFTQFVGMSVRNAGGNAKLNNLASNVSSLVVFLIDGQVLIPLGMAAAVFSVLGHYVGAGVAIKNGSKMVRPIIICVIVLLFVKVIFDIT